MAPGQPMFAIGTPYEGAATAGNGVMPAIAVADINAVR